MPAHKNKVPVFVGNSLTGLDCMHCSYIMAINGLKPAAPLIAIGEFDKIVDKTPGKYSWYFRPCTTLAQQGFKIKSVSLWDNAAFLADPEAYLIEYYGEETGRNQFENSDMPKLIQEVRDADQQKSFIFEKRVPEFDDIKREIDAGNYVIPELNHYTLIGEPSYEGHAIVIFGYNYDGVQAHNPGGKANGQHAYAFYPWSLFDKAWSWPEKRNRNYVSIGLE